jgi:hypothetical protein
VCITVLIGIHPQRLYSVGSILSDLDMGLYNRVGF